MMIRTPTVPFFAFQSAMMSATAGSFGSTRFDQAEPVRVLCLHFEDVARVVTVHRERRHQHRAVDPDRIHCSHHLVARHLLRPDQSASPWPARMVALIGVHLGVDYRPSGGAGGPRQPGGGDHPGSGGRGLDEFAAVQVLRHWYPPSTDIPRIGGRALAIR
jgi:hypothetical protein